MSTICIEHADLLVTMDGARRELRDGALVTDGPAIAWVGATADLPPELRDGADEVIDARHCIVLPGFVNTHHHFYQTLTRVIPAA
ncbi:MAG: 8-oxoguanine deaminase, partial [Caldilinea sp.]|nr:8-oxoguanine deaminase [Caldilinea sp.]